MFSVRNQGNAIIELIKTSWTLHLPCLHIVIVIADGGGVEEGGGGDHHWDWPNAHHEEAGEGRWEVRVSGPSDGHVPVVIISLYYMLIKLMSGRLWALMSYNTKSTLQPDGIDWLCSDGSNSLDKLLENALFRLKIGVLADTKPLYSVVWRSKKYLDDKRVFLFN